MVDASTDRNDDAGEIDSDSFYASDGWNEDDFLDVIDRRLSGAREESDPPEDATFWKQRLEKLAIPASKFESMVHSKCTKKQAQAVLAAYHGKTPEEIAKEQHKSRQTVQELLQYALERLKT